MYVSVLSTMRRTPFANRASGVSRVSRESRAGAVFHMGHDDSLGAQLERAPDQFLVVLRHGPMISTMIGEGMWTPAPITSCPSANRRLTRFGVS